MYVRAAHRYCKKLSKCLEQQSRSQAGMQLRACSTQLPASRCNTPPPFPPPPPFPSFPAYKPSMACCKWGCLAAVSFPLQDCINADCDVIEFACKRCTPSLQTELGFPLSLAGGSLLWSDLQNPTCVQTSLRAPPSKGSLSFPFPLHLENPPPHAFLCLWLESTLAALPLLSSSSSSRSSSSSISFLLQSSTFMSKAYMCPV